MRQFDPNSKFDVIIVGAGINGAGIARDASMRGLNTLLLDKGDIGGGTSSASTRLIHGGLRYLEHGELGLVRESLRERETLLRIAPHLVRSLPLLVPIYRRSSRGRLTIRTGMIAYDLLSAKKTLPRHKMLSRAETLQRISGLESEDLEGAALYYDGHVEFAERLVLENALSAREHGATVLTYTKFDRLIIDGGKLRGIEFTDEYTATQSAALSSLVVNAAGPWVDEVLTGTNPQTRLIGGTKGSHIVVKPFAGAPCIAIYVEAQTDGRPFFIIPWNENYLIGTTDIRYEGDLDRVEISQDEIDYLLKETNRLFPGARLEPDSICFSYSGVRPLAFSEDKDEQSITRRHFVREHKTVAGLISIVGGKLTTYRSLAEETVDLVGRRLSKKLPPSGTAQSPLPGAETEDFRTFCEKFKRGARLPSSGSDRLLRLYGTRAAAIFELATEDESLAEVIDAETGALAAEVVFACQTEFAKTIADCMLRRTMLGLNCTRGLNAVDAVGRIHRDHLGWSNERVAEEIRQYRLAVRNSGYRTLPT